MNEVSTEPEVDKLRPAVRIWTLWLWGISQNSN